VGIHGGRGIKRCPFGAPSFSHARVPLMLLEIKFGVVQINKMRGNGEGKAIKGELQVFSFREKSVETTNQE
jgi:hypothetical protein